MKLGRQCLRQLPCGKYNARVDVVKGLQKEIIELSESVIKARVDSNV
jgi:hypothetical protein